MKTDYKKLVLSSLFLSLALVLPLLTGQIPEIGKALCPMHLPVLLCGFILGPLYGCIVGFIAPLLRFVIFGMPPIFPNGLSMAFELCAYGGAAGILIRLLPRKKVYLYIALISAMLLGRLVWGGVSVLLYGIAGKQYGFPAFIAGAFADAVWGIALQIIVIPPLLILLEKPLRGFGINIYGKDEKHDA